MFVNKNEIDADVLSDIEFYYQHKDETPVFPGSIVGYLGALLKHIPHSVFIVDNMWVRGGTERFFMQRCDLIQTVKETAVQYRALVEAIEILNARGVACFFFNRPGLNKQFPYDERALIRIKDKLSFTKMIQDTEKYADDFRQILGSDYDTEYINDLTAIPQIIKKDNIYVHEDRVSRLVNVKNGRRVTTDQTETPKHKVYVFGRCGAFGYAVSDEDSLPSALQREFNKKDLAEYSVINQGLWGANDNNIIHNFLLKVSDFREGDIIVFYLKHFDFRILEKLESKGLWFCNLTDPWHEFPEAKYCFYDKPGHMGAKGYENAAKLIFNYIESKNFEARLKNTAADLSAVHLNNYIKNLKDTDFEDNINRYLASIKNDIPNDVIGSKCGAIVMNCNPFTLGHRYLIEKALEQVEYLYVFVVEEDRSYFKFSDRFEMVKSGTEDLEKVYVIPSGRFVISALTFPEYFLKDYVREKDFDVSGDIEIFCKYISPALGIKKRFVGEEPFDPITNSYNTQMKELLPEYGMELIEISRAANEDGEVINATRVRELISAEEYEKLDSFLPESTIRIIKEKYAGKQQCSENN